MTLKRYILGAILLMLAWTINIPAQELGGITVNEEPPNLIQEENTEPGTREWQIKTTNQANDRQIEGYPSKPSVNIGEPIYFYVNVTDGSPEFKIEIFRMGWYDGTGGRLRITLDHLPAILQPQPEANHLIGLMECAWTLPQGAQWAVPNAGRWGGMYIARLTASSGKQSYIRFVVRDDERRSDFLFQASVTTEQAYNSWPRHLLPNQQDPEWDWFRGKSLYAAYSYGLPIPQGNPNGLQARMVSFNRPYMPDQNSIYWTAGYFFSHGEYNMVRWMEKEGYDVTYTTDVDTDAATDMINGPLSPGRHKVFLSVSHDEYWSWQMRDNLETARNHPTQPLNIGWFGANDVHWQIRFQNSSMTNSSPADAERRTMIAYKDLARSNITAWKDPVYTLGGSPTNYLTTDLWRNMSNPALMGTQCPFPNCFKPPEDELVGVMTTTPNTVTGRGDFNFYTGGDDEDDPPFPAWILGDITNLAAIPNLVGYEADQIFTSAYNDQTTGDRWFWQLGQRFTAILESLRERPPRTRSSTS